MTTAPKLIRLARRLDDLAVDWLDGLAYTYAKEIADELRSLAAEPVGGEDLALDLAISAQDSAIRKHLAALALLERIFYYGYKGPMCDPSQRVTQAEVRAALLQTPKQPDSAEGGCPHGHKECNGPRGEFMCLQCLRGELRATDDGKGEVDINSLISEDYANAVEQPKAEGVVSHAAAREMLDSLDDCARMDVGVDAKGNRETLERYITQQESAAPQPELYDTWAENPYTKVLMKSLAEDYVPRNKTQPVQPARDGVADRYSFKPSNAEPQVCYHCGQGSSKHARKMCRLVDLQNMGDMHKQRSNRSAPMGFVSQGALDEINSLNDGEGTQEVIVSQQTPHYSVAIYTQPPQQTDGGAVAIVTNNVFGDPFVKWMDGSVAGDHMAMKLYAAPPKSPGVVVDEEMIETALEAHASCFEHGNQPTDRDLIISILDAALGGEK